jgi:3-methylcrotonyl-CoA carboxylase alpha subunit
MFAKVLIANRGEIACRVMRTARRLGMHTVAVYSDADRDALHVAMADEALRIGPPSAAESYLDGARIIEAALASGAEAIHPGYGFLSENAGFAEAVEAAGLVFVGPTAAAIRAMGLKDAAKALMQRAGVPIVPGYHGEAQDYSVLAEHAEAIGYPILIKARAGGGGKGMRRVENASGLRAALDGARREAEAAFGDGAVLIEKYLGRSRHIEVQVFGDRQGNAVHLFERDCSLQRRHQKVIEEAPAPGMTAAMRHEMGEAAVRAAKAIGYVGAGTVEFIADVSEGLRPDRFFFMEMNTRLQVEHPVTEAITGQDLVEWQFRVAAGEPLPLRQEELSIDGWAFEARLYAENPAKQFLPSTGRLARFEMPVDEARVDTGVREGDEVTPYYDPLLAKLIVHGDTREAALRKLRHALARCRIAGIATNAGFLGRLAAEPGFVAGEVDTGLIDRTLAALAPEPEAPPEVWAVAALAALGLLAPAPDGDPWAALRGFRLWAADSQFASLESGGLRRDVRVGVLGGDRYEIREEEATLTLKILQATGQGARIDIGGRIEKVEVARAGPALTVFLRAAAYDFAVPDHHEADAADVGDADRIVAPMPGKITHVAVSAGSRVARGEALIVMEAMKMELTLAAPRDGIVEAIAVAAGDQVVESAVLLALHAGAE